MSTYPGIYRAVVVDDDDPERLRRLKVQVPAVYGDGDSLWASACVPAGSRLQPTVGSGVWVMFEEGDPARPVWMGVVVAGRMNVAAYRSLFRTLGFTSYESHKKLRHPKLTVTAYFNCNRAGFVWFAVRANQFDAFKPALWEVIPPPQKKDKDPGIRTVVPRSGQEAEAFRDLLGR